MICEAAREYDSLVTNMLTWPFSLYGHSDRARGTSETERDGGSGTPLFTGGAWGTGVDVGIGDGVIVGVGIIGAWREDGSLLDMCCPSAGEIISCSTRKWISACIRETTCARSASELAMIVVGRMWTNGLVSLLQRRCGVCVPHIF